MTQHSIHIFLAMIYSSEENIWASFALQGIIFIKTAWFAGLQLKQKDILLHLKHTKTLPASNSGIRFTSIPISSVKESCANYLY